MCQDCGNESVQPDLSEDHFAAVKSDASIELYSISKAFEDLSVTCDAVVAKDLLKGLLHDRGKGMKICGLKIMLLTLTDFYVKKVTIL